MDKRKFPRSIYNGIADPEESLVEILTADKQRFRRVSKVVYRGQRCGCLLGFAYPVRMVHPGIVVKFGQLDDDGILVVNAPTIEGECRLPDRPAPFGPWVICEPLESGYEYLTWWFFAYRSIDPDWVFQGDEPDGFGIAPAGGVRGYRRNKEAPEDVKALSSPGEIWLAGERDVWRVADQALWELKENKPPLFVSENPAGLMICDDMQAEVSRAQVLEDMRVYKPHRPIHLAP